MAMQLWVIVDRKTRERCGYGTNELIPAHKQFRRSTASCAPELEGTAALQTVLRGNFTMPPKKKKQERLLPNGETDTFGLVIRLYWPKMLTCFRDIIYRSVERKKLKSLSNYLVGVVAVFY